MPCADRAGDIVGLLLDGGDAPAGTVVVFGQVFRPGDVPAGGALAARLAANGQRLPTQLDVSRRHPDGSARFGLVSLAVPALPAGRRIGVVLARGTSTGEALDLAHALAGRRAEVEITPRDGGNPWRADLAALLRAAPPATRWQSGPLVTQARLVQPVPIAGITSMRLVADVAVRADGTLWVEAWLRNDIAMQPGGGEAAYALRILLDGREALSADVPRHWQYAGWGRLVGSAPGGRPAPEPPLVRHDPAYLAETGAVLPYDLSTGVEEAVLGRFAEAMRDAGWRTPLGSRTIQTRMGTGGGRPDIGQTTLAQAAWIMTGDARAAAFSVGQAEAAGSAPWHYWDARGGWLDVQRWPLFWDDARGGRPPFTLLQPAGNDTGWGLASSHQPDLSYVPYLLTGRRAFLDNLMAQAAWNVSSVWPRARRGRTPSDPAHDRIIVQDRQVRGSAWGLRQIDEAAWIAAEDEASRAYIEQVAAANWAWLRARIPEWTAQQGEVHGWLPGVYGVAGALPPWQQDYFASTVAAAARRGREDARAFLDWMRNFLVGRFFADDKGFTRNDGVAYLLAISPLPVSSPPQVFQTWAQLGAATRERGMSNENGWRRSEGEYGRLGLLSLALVHHVLGDERAREAHAWVVAAQATATAEPFLARIPSQNVAPRGMPRAPARLPRCSQGSGP
jgi:hypothetical protein